LHGFRIGCGGTGLESRVRREGLRALSRTFRNRLQTSPGKGRRIREKQPRSFLGSFFCVMCGIAGYSLSPDSNFHRTLAAQALLAGIAERGADAVGYAYRAAGDAYPTVVKQRTPASHLLERI